MNLKHSFLRTLDIPLIVVTLIISVLGLFFLKSATYTYSTDYLTKQTIWLILGILVLIAVLKIGYLRLVELSPILYILGLFLFVLILLIGDPKLGAQRWLQFRFFTFQPSEFFKVVLILLLSRYLGYYPRSLYLKRNELKKISVCGCLTLLPILLILKQPDLGTALVLGFIFLIIIYVWGTRIKYIIFIAVCGLVSLPLFWHLLRGYQKRRLLVFLNPDLDPLGAGYTVIQSKIAIGSGGFLGKGWLAGTQSQLNFLPEHHTDFIFSVIGEEWGFLGGLLVILLYLFLILRALRIARLSKNRNGRLIAAGIAGLLLIHIIINIGMNIGIMPITGLPLLLISYGGSSLITTLSAIGLLLSIDRENRLSH
ncbi:MAG: rod shape-determining protein RodA [Candidatus Omnitrophica bacterium]|nr:rod shape-determining protein RodA [Candidatus Omnitrophota bacterium]